MPQQNIETGLDSLSPVSESDRVTRRPASGIKNDTHQYQSNDGHHLDQGEPELHLAVDLDAQKVG